MSLDDIFDDAHRRVCIAKQRGETNRPRMWTGLAMPSEMKRAIALGYMRPVYSRETARVLNWYTFTDTGWREYDRRYAGKPDWFATDVVGPYCPFPMQMGDEGPVVILN